MRLTMVSPNIARNSLAVLVAALMNGILQKNKNADVKTLSELDIYSKCTEKYSTEMYSTRSGCTEMYSTRSRSIDLSDLIKQKLPKHNTYTSVV